MYFKKHGPRNDRNSCADRGIEALQMSNLTDAAESVRKADQFVGFGERCRQRLFDEHVDSGLHQLLGGFEVVNRRYRHRGSLDFAVGGGELLDRAKTTASKFARNRGSARRIRVDDSDQPYRDSFFGELMVDASVVAAKGAYTNHGDVNRV